MIWPKSKEKMQMIGHAVYSDHFMPIIPDNSCDVLMKPFLPALLYHRIAEFHREYTLNMNLGIGVGHTRQGFAPMGQTNVLIYFFYRPVAPTEQ